MESLFVLAALFFLAGPILAIVALVKVSHSNARLRGMMAELEHIRKLLDTSPRPVRAEAAVEAAPAQTPLPEIAVAQRSEDLRVEPVAIGTAAEAIASETQPPSGVAPAKHRAWPTPPQPAASAEGAAAPSRNVEQAIASRWFVWLGGAAVALGGLLLVKYAHDNNLVPPALRVAIGLAIAAALVFAGERLRMARDETSPAAYYVPAAVSAAGLVIAFGVIYAAYALYDLVSAGVCFPGLVLVGLTALWLSRRQGPLIAALGLVGSYAAPALVPSEHPSAWGFFAYLLVIVAASLLELRQRPWWWLGIAALAGATAWSLLWISGGMFEPPHTLPAGLFALAGGAAAAFLPRGRAILGSDMGSLLRPRSMRPPMRIAVLGFIMMAVVLVATVLAAGHGRASLVLFATGMAAITAFGWLRNGLVAAPLAAVLVTLITLLAWPDVGFQDWAMDERGLWTTVPGNIQPPHFVTAMALALAAFTAIGIAGLLRRADPRPWAALAAAAALLFLFGAWARADFVLGDTAWAVAGAGLAAALLAAAYALRPRLAAPEAGLAIDMLIAGAALLALFALDRLFDGLWYTLAAAGLAAAVAGATRLWPRPNVGGIASALASFVAVRLFVSRDFWDGATSLPLGAHWPIYGYGVPAVLFWLASRWLPAENFGRWRAALEGVALGLAISLVSLELRVLMAGGITADHMGLAELAAHALAWLGAAYGLAYRQSLFSSFITLWGARVLLAAAFAALLAGLTIANPVISEDALPGGRIFNALWLAYLAPVVLLALLARKLNGLGLGGLRNGLGIFALVLVMAFVTLWVKRQFQDALMVPEFTSQAESYSVSLAWLVTGIAIFIAGLKFGRSTIRYGGFAVLIFAILKAFGYDLFELGGLWRIASIIGLGACLIGVGWLYTRFVQPPRHANAG